MTLSTGNLAPLRNRAWLVREYTDAGRTTTDIARELDCNPGTVTNAVNRHGIASHSKGFQRPGDPLDDPAWLREQYATRSAEQIAAELTAAGHPAPAQTVRRRLYEAGIPTRTKGVRAGAVAQAHSVLDDPEWLRARYVQEGLSVREIAPLARAGSDRVRQALKAAGIPLHKPGRRATA